MLTNNNFVVSPHSSGNGHSASAGQFNLVQVKQEPVDSASGASQDSAQEHSLDLSKKDHRCILYSHVRTDKLNEGCKCNVNTVAAEYLCDKLT